MKINLTKTVVEKLKPDPERQVVFWDAKQSGFAVRINPAGSKTFFYQGYLNGREKKVTLGRFGKISPEQARKEAVIKAGEMNKGVDPSRPKIKKGRVTLGELLELYIESLYGKPSKKAVENSIRKHIEKPFRGLWRKPASDITTPDCDDIRRKIQGKTPRQAELLLSYLKAAYFRAINGELSRSASALGIHNNPAASLKHISRAKNLREKVLSKKELQDYWRRINELQEPVRSILILHLLSGGQRQQQLVRVRRKHIDMDAMTMTLIDSKGARKQPRIHKVPLLPMAVDCIKTLCGGEYVFSCNGGESPIHPTYIHKHSKQVLADMGLNESAGVIRATVETRLAGEGIASDVLAQLLSHGLGGVQNVSYQRHDYTDEKRKAIQTLLRILQGKAEVRKLRAVK